MLPFGFSRVITVIRGIQTLLQKLDFTQIWEGWGKSGYGFVLGGGSLISPPEASV